MPVQPLPAPEPSQRTPRKRRRSAENEQGAMSVAVPESSEERSFRIWFLSRETGISQDQAGELVDSLGPNGAALLSAARVTKTRPAA